MQYRREIDGLRALAVVPVILFHADFELFRGGFVGVDVFFVISGYLITLIIFEARRNGTFSLLKFYERRARRILPALFLVMICTIPFALIWMLPSQLKGFSTSVVAVSAFVSNFLYWKKDGYFADTEFEPFIHTWSLAVEEQYYVIFPLLVLICGRFDKKFTIYTIAVIAAASFLLSEYGATRYPAANFYLLPGRAWEIMAGALCAVAHSEKKIGQSNALSLLGLLLILFSIFSLDETTPYPSAYALIPVLGSVMIILFASEKTVVGRLLSIKAFVGVGLISYSAYLWHQPLFALARIKLLHEPSTVLMLALCIVSLILAYFSWRFVEQPIRRRRSLKPIPSTRVIGSALAISLLFIGIGLVGQRNAAAISPYPRQADFEWGYYVRTFACHLNDPLRLKHDQVCFETGDQTGEPKVLLWGDSNAASLYPGLKRLQREQGFSLTQMTQASCPPIFDLVNLTRRRNCNSLNKIVFSHLIENNYDAILMHAAWSHGHYPMSEETLRKKLDATVKEIKRRVSQDTEIILVGPVPRWHISGHNVFVRSESDLFQKESNIYTKSVIPEEVERTVRSVAQENGVKFISVIETFCEKTAPACIISTSYDISDVLYADSQHLSKSGSELLFQFLTNKFQNKLFHSSETRSVQ